VDGGDGLLESLEDCLASRFRAFQEQFRFDRSRAVRPRRQADDLATLECRLMGEDSGAGDVALSTAFG
jgi:hypothetical protein